MKIKHERQKMKEIKLTQGKVAWVDYSDYEYLYQFKWFAMKNKHCFYAGRYTTFSDGKKRLLLMHRLILGLQVGNKRHTDHIDGNGLDNRKFNIRIATPSQNQGNSKPAGGSSKFKGVYWHKVSKKWGAQVQHYGKFYYMGLFEDEIDAARAYDTKAREIFGSFARLNLVNHNGVRYGQKK